MSGHKCPDHLQIFHYRVTSVPIVSVMPANDPAATDTFDTFDTTDTIQHLDQHDRNLFIHEIMVYYSYNSPGYAKQAQPNH